jgi:ubiquinone/menaquinone biosynthesis C-methylase UbiE
VVEIGCGTGLNFPYLISAIGPKGTLIGVDLTAAMLDKAKQRVDAHGWRNVQLVRTDAGVYPFPGQVEGVISSFALTLVPEYDQVIARAQKALRPGGRLSVLDLKLPENWPARITRLAVFVTRPFGVTLELAQRRPWEAMRTRFPRTEVTGLYGGFAYIAVAVKA